MSTQMINAAIRSRAPPTMAPTREMLSAIVCKRCIPPSTLPTAQKGTSAYGVGALSPSALPLLSFHSLAHSAPQRLAHPARTAPSTSFLCVSASSGFTATIVDLASLPIVHGCWPILQLIASAVVVLIVAHILSS